MRRPPDPIHEDGTPSVAVLPDHERYIAALVSYGLDDAEIVRRLGIAPDEVAYHLGHALRALGLQTRLQFAVWAVEQGLHRQAC